MAGVDVSVSSDLSPERAWALASDLVAKVLESDVRKSVTNLAALR